MRLFLASYATIECYEELRNALSPYFDAKWVEPKNLHLTWYFLGEHPDAAPFVERLQALSMIPRLPMTLRGLGIFGKPDPTVLYAATSSVVGKVLHEKVAELLGLEPDPRFTPHVTLARVKTTHPGWKEAPAPWQERELGQVESTIYLIQSHLTPQGPIYIPLESF